MEFHQLAFAQAVAFACAVSFGMGGCDSGREAARAPAPGAMVKTAGTTAGNRAMNVARGVEGAQSNEVSVKK